MKYLIGYKKINWYYIIIIYLWGYLYRSSTDFEGTQLLLQISLLFCFLPIKQYNIIVATYAYIAKEDFPRESLSSEKLLLIADEVHCVGSSIRKKKGKRMQSQNLLC